MRLLTVLILTSLLMASTVSAQQFAVAERTQTVVSATAATPVDMSLGTFILDPLTENTTIGAPTNASNGMLATFKFTNTASNRTVAWNAAFHFVGSSAPTITVGVKDSIVVFKYDGAAAVWNEVSRALNE